MDFEGVDDILPGVPVPFETMGGSSSSLFKGKSATVDTLPPYLAGTKTPIKDSNVPVRVGSQPIQLLATDCTCGMNLSQFHYWICIARAENPQMKPDEVYRLWSKNYFKTAPMGRPDGNLNLKMCCRTRLLAPTSDKIVSKDIDACILIEFETLKEIKSNEPPPTSQIFKDDMIPPPIHLVTES